VFGEATMNEIATHPSRNDWIACIVAFPAFTAIGSIVPLLALQYLAADSATGRVPRWGSGGSLIFGAGLAFWFVRRTINRQCWRLTESELIGGWRGALRLSLSSIEKVIIGLPGELPVPGMDKLTSPLMQQVFVSGRANSLLLGFQDGSLLPLTLHRMPNGSALIAELLSRLQDRVERTHTYSAEEIKLLKRADPNALLRKG
jgi:hypothetical protein